MALLFMDGFDGYTAESDLVLKWDSGSNITFLQTALGRFGGGAAEVDVSNNEFLLKTILDSTTVIAGGAFKMDRIDDGEDDTNLLIGFDEQGVVSHISLVQHFGFLAVKLGLGDGTELGRTSGVVLTPGVWHYLEMKVFLSNSATGTVEVFLDGFRVINLDTIVTSNGGADVIDRVIFRSPSLNSGHDTLWDDCYICDGVGGAPHNTILGDCRIDQIIPNGDGNYTEFVTTVPSSPATHWDKVEEVPPDDDTSYNNGTAVNQRDTFTMSALTAITSQTIFGVQQVSHARHDGSATNMENRLRISASDFSGVSQALPSSYGYILEVWEDDPNAGPLWTESVINGLESGYEQL